MAYVWLALGIAALIGAIFFGAYWHLLTAGFSYLMYDAHAYEAQKEKGE